MGIVEFFLCLTPTVTVVDCGSPPSITNGSPGTPDMTTFGGTVTYTCNNGYETSLGMNMSTVSCLATGLWDTPSNCTGELCQISVSVLFIIVLVTV